MKNLSLANFIGTIIDDYGFSASDVARVALTHEANTVVPVVVPAPVEAVAPMKKKRPNRQTIKRSAHGSMQPGGHDFEAIRTVIFNFDGFTTVSDISKVSAQPAYRVTKVTNYLEKRGELRRQGRQLVIVS